jgi:phytoene synthase
MGGSSFAPAFFLLPAQRRRALFALHGFCRAADDAVDSGERDPLEAEKRLELFRRQVGALYGEGPLEVPEALALAPYVRPFELERSHFEHLLDALACDIHGPVITTEDDLIHYCEGVASAPGYLSLAIFGCPEAGSYAKTLGLALQCTNILRDARQDLLASRVYLPAEELTRAGIERAELVAQARGEVSVDERTHTLIESHRRRTLVWFEAADEAYRAQSAPTRKRLVAARGMQRIYRNLFDRLRRREPLPRSRLRTGKLRAASALLESWSEAHLGVR